MKKKKLLARSIVLGLLCASVLSTSAWAETVSLNISDTTTPLTFLDSSYSLDSAGTVVKITGNTDKEVTFGASTGVYGDVRIVTNHDDSTGMVHALSAAASTTTINGSLQFYDYGPSGAHYSIDNQRGKLVFNDDIYADGIVRNSANGTLIANGSMDVHVSVNDESELSVGIINEGRMKVTDGFGLDVSVFSNSTSGEIGPYSE